MKVEKELLAYCGFYCGDCLGYTGVVADAAKDLKRVLDRYQFVRTAQSVFPEQLKDYGSFYEMLGFITSLRCPGICRREVAAGGTAACVVKNCCLEQGFFACYECGDLERCEVLTSVHEGLHADACLQNLRAIRQMGLEVWLAQGKRCCYWLDGSQE